MKNKKIFSLCLIFLFVISICGFAQSGATGRIRVTQVSVTISANVKGDSVTLNGEEKGFTTLTVKLNPGAYTLVVEAKGYQKYSSRITVTKDAKQTFKVALKSQTVSVQIVTNVKGADILINNKQMGITPAVLKLIPGNYKLSITAKGYELLETTLRITAQSKQKYSFDLQPLQSKLNVVIPAQFIDPSFKENKVKIFIDDKLMSAVAAITQLVIEPGKHNIRISSPAGGLSVAKDLIFKAGVEYTIEIFMDLIIE